MCCLPRHLPIARLAVDGLQRYSQTRSISVITQAAAFRECQRVLGSDVTLLDERELSAGMTIGELRARADIFGFPERAGWYFQQIVKLGFALRDAPEDFYLIWDCDTVALRPLEFFTPEGRPWYTLAEEHHLPYFETYARLFGYEPVYEGSFISQHMVVERAVAREMFAELCARFPEERSWSWAIMNHLSSSPSKSLFSEYETYGNYVKSRHPDRIAFRHVPWLREAAAQMNTTIPTRRQLDELAKNYDFAAFETWQIGKVAKLRDKLRSLLG